MIMILKQNYNIRSEFWSNSATTLILKHIFALFDQITDSMKYKSEYLKQIYDSINSFDDSFTDSANVVSD